MGLKWPRIGDHLNEFKKKKKKKKEKEKEKTVLRGKRINKKVVSLSLSLSPYNQARKCKILHLLELELLET
jgi:hypothetical protein